VIPARDEAEILGETLEALRTITGLSRIIVVDDGSQDATAGIARSSGAEVLSTSSPGKSRGKGHALRLGLTHTRKKSSKALLLADADLGPSAARLAELLDALDEHNPVVVAAFPPATTGGFGLKSAPIAICASSPPRPPCAAGGSGCVGAAGAI
jgi:glucosyl-3-phosphoglycerate synthase